MLEVDVVGLDEEEDEVGGSKRKPGKIMVDDQKKI